MYFEVSASCSAFSSSARSRLSISRFLRSTSSFCSDEQLAPSPRAPRWSAAALPAAAAALEPEHAPASSLGLSQLLRVCSRSDCDCLSSSPSHRRGDGVEDDADALGELVEEGQVDVAEAVERRQLDDRLDLALEQHRQDDDVESAWPSPRPELMWT